MQTTAADPLVGRTLEGRYRILDRIARGGMSTVYSAMDERLDRLVAVKVMSAALSADPAFSDRFTREARAAARLTHLNTVAVYDQGWDSGDAGQHVFLVMELVNGRTVRDLLRERGRLEPAEAFAIIEPVLSALSAAHRAGLVHRDIKPENILLSDDGIVKVADFGLARAVESDPTATRTGLMMGTVAYCAPEQLSKGRADKRSDVYSAGVVFFELLTGSTPYRGDTAMNIAYQHVHSRVPAPSSRVKGIPSEIDELVVAATDSDPDGRPADAAEFLAELADVRKDLALPVVAVPSRPRGAGAHDSARRLADETSGAVTDVLRGGGDGPYGRHDTSVVGREPRRTPPPAAQRPPARPPADPQRLRRQRRRRRSLLAALIVVLVGIAAGYTGWWFATGRYGKVPNVVGDSQSSAVTALRQAGYQVSSKTSTAFSETVATGAVVSTSPAVGSRVPHGRTVSLVLSKGKERFTVPPVSGMTEAQARQALSTIPVNVAAQTESKPSDTVPKGKVSGTDPPAQSLVKRNQQITLVISTGPPIVTIPPVSPNTSLADETKLLQARGFKTTSTLSYSTTVPNGDVISINPTGSAPKFTTISINVSKGPPTVTIPDFSDLPTVAAARAKLESLGLKVKVQSAFGGSHQLVVGVDPPAGTVVPVGSIVTITSI